MHFANCCTRILNAHSPLRTKKPADLAISGLLIKPGSVLLSHCLTAAVLSALEGLTSVFGMGTGVTPPAWPPGNSMKTLNADGRTQDLFRSFFQKSSLSCHKNSQESFALVFGEKDLTCRPFGAATQ